MSDPIPFEMQEEIMKKVPVKSLIRFRSVSKQWKSLIDSSKFIKNYHANHSNPQHHLLVQYKLGNYEVKYISIIDDDTFPNHKFSVTFPQAQDFSDQYISGYSSGILYIHYSNTKFFGEDMAVLWNPTVRKTVGVVIPHLPTDFLGGSMVGFGVCPNTNDPKLVQVNVSNIPNIKWEAKVFTLSTKVWKTVTIPSTLFHNHDMYWGSRNVCAQGFVYFLALDAGSRSKLIVLFDLMSEKFGKLYLPDSLVHSRDLCLSKRNECLTLLEIDNVDDVQVWMMNDGVTKSITKIFTLKSLGSSCPFGWRKVLGFGKNGKALITTSKVVDDDDTNTSLVEVCDPYSGRINDIGINGLSNSFDVCFYMETLLLIDQADSVIY